MGHHFKGGCHLVPAQSMHNRATIWLKPNKALTGKFLDGLAHGCTGHAHLLAQNPLVEPHTWLKAALDDLTSNAIGHGIVKTLTPN
jgi:hypothetical protein